MDLFVLVFAVLSNTLLGLVVYLRNPRGSLEGVFSLICLCINLWAVSNFIVNHPSPQTLAVDDLANRIAYASGYGVMMAGLAFTYFFPLKRTIQTRKLLLFLGVGALMLCISATDAVAGRTIINASGAVEFTLGPLLWLYIVGFLLFIIAIGRNLLQTPGGKDNKIRKQAYFILVAFCLTATFALTLNAILPLIGFGWETTRFGPLTTVVLVGMVSYSIIKHGLFDIKLAVVRTIGYGGVLLTLSLVYYLLAHFASITLLGGATTQAVSVSPVNIFLALLLAFLFQPLKQFFDRTTNRIFYRDTYNSEDFFARLSELLASTTDLRGLLERASREIASTMKAEQGSFFVYYSNSINHYMTAGTKRYTRMPMFDARALDTFVMANKDEIFVTELLEEKDEEVRRLLISHDVVIFMPLRYKKSIIGYLFLGDRLTSSYSQRDLKVLTTIADNLIIAIQNALSVHEVREINASLQQRIEAATAELRESNIELHRLDMAKDEFVSMASHQLRTPLTSIKGYVSMMLDGDVGRITGAQKDALEEAYNSSERMVRLIGDFLSVSRLQTGKFMVEKKPSNLVDVVKQEVAGLRMIASTHGQKIAFKPPKSLPIIVVDESKLRQVMMNFMDNAVYYSKTNSTITVTLAQEDEDIIFTVVDTGIGVPLEEQKKLFRKFFRAGNARQQRPDGTGVGLFLAKRIVAEHHGKIIFKSVEGEGSTFGFRIPLDQKTDDTNDDKKNSK